MRCLILRSALHFAALRYHSATDVCPSCLAEPPPVNPRLPAQIGRHRCGPGQPLVVIAGPCVVESAELCLLIAETLAVLASRLPIQVVFKASYDKANRTSGGCQDILLCERGTFFGYGRLVNDFTGLPAMRALGVPVIFDATHSVQRPASLGEATGGDRTLVEPLARAAAAVGIDGVFFETHPDPDTSPSDGPNMVPLDQLGGVLERVLRIHEAKLAGERV